MNNVYRVKMQDQVNGETFTFTVTYKTSGKDSAAHLARNEFGQQVVITEVKRMVV